MNYINQIILGDCNIILKEIPDNSIDLIATDPPYGYSFMGKDWDNFKATRNTKSQVITNLGAGMKRTTQQENINYQHWVTEWAKECLRVLKDGAFMFYCMAPRQDLLSRALIGLEDAGFDVGFTSIYWTYSSGFPKAANISLAVDKRECKRLLQEKLNREPTKKEFKEEWKNFRSIVGKRIDAYGDPNLSETKDGRNVWGKESTREIDLINNEPVSLQAKDLDGSFGGFQPKPSVEIIIVAMKSLDEKTYVDQALKNKKGITWFDDCRIPYKNDYDKKHQADIQRGQDNADMGRFFGGKGISKSSGNLQGRFPANLLVSDDILNDGIDKKSGDNCIRRKPGTFLEHYYGGEGVRQITYGDSGSYSRYFDLDIWFDKQFEKLPENVQKIFPFLIIPKAAKSEKNKGLTGGTGSNTYNRKCLKCKKWERNQGIDKEKYTCVCEKPEWETPKGNIHPTTKPIKLMSYLITLGSRENDIVLDPFLGSGTTAIAAKILKRKYIGIELNQEYFDIAQKRLSAVEETLL